MSSKLDIDTLQQWIGREERSSDTISTQLLNRFAATLDGYTAFNPATPHGIHWCLAPPALPQEQLGVDSHPATGGFIPPMPLPRRMWAASDINFFEPLLVNIDIERTSTIADVQLKHSKSAGPLVFVSIDHVFQQLQDIRIKERQTLVYRDHTAFKSAAPKAQAAIQQTVSSHHMTPNTTLMFRYSALTFNGHRIHYDHCYATEEEGYPGLVVHGPLMATVLMNSAQAQHSHATLKRFSFRGMAPAFVDQQLQINTLDKEAGTLEILNEDGALVMQATAEFQSL